MRCLYTFLILTILLTNGCNIPMQADGNGIDAFENNPASTPVVQSDETVNATPKKSESGDNQDGTSISPLSTEMIEMPVGGTNTLSLARFSGSTPMNNTDLFQAIFLSLTQSNWLTLSECFLRVNEYLPDDNKLDSPLESGLDLDLSKYGLDNPSQLLITQRFRYDMDLAYIEINKIYDSYARQFVALLLFDIDNICYRPIGIYFCDDYQSTEFPYQLVGNKSVRWIYDEPEGTMGSDEREYLARYTNIDSRRIDFFYASYQYFRLGSASGTWDFVGNIAPPMIVDSNDKLIRIYLINTMELCFVNGYNSTVIEKQASFSIIYDISEQKAHIEDSSTHWQNDSFLQNYEIIGLFENELSMYSSLEHNTYAEHAKVLLGELAKHSSAAEVLR